MDFTAKEALRTVTLWLLVAYGALRFFVMMGMGTHIIAFQFGIGISAVTAAMIGSVMSTVMAVTQLGAGFIALRVNMHTLVRVASFMGMCAFPILLFADSVSMMLIYAVASGIAGGIGSIAMGNLFPDYFGRSEFPKIMGYTMPFNTFFSSFGAPFLGFIHDKTGGYLPGLRIFFVLMVVSFVCILFAKPPIHPSLKGNAQEAAPEGQLAG